MVVCNLHPSIRLIDFKYKHFGAEEKDTKDNTQKEESSKDLRLFELCKQLRNNL